MRKEVRTLSPIGATAAVVPCRTGERVRVLSVTGAVSGVATGDQILLTLFRAGVIIAFIPLPMLNTSTSAWCTAVGLNAIEPIATNFDPVTGIQTFNTIATVSAALPDIWSDEHDMSLTISTASGSTPVLNSVVYEIEKNT